VIVVVAVVVGFLFTSVGDGGRGEVVEGGRDGNRWGSCGGSVECCTGVMKRWRGWCITKGWYIVVDRCGAW